MIKRMCKKFSVAYWIVRFHKLQLFSASLPCDAVLGSLWLTNFRFLHFLFFFCGGDGGNAKTVVMLREALKKLALGRIQMYTWEWYFKCGEMSLKNQLQHGQHKTVKILKKLAYHFY